MRDDRDAWVRRGLRLNYVTLAYNAVEAIVALMTGLLSGSVALVGFGFDSVIELAASGVAQWRLRVDIEIARRARVDRLAARLIAWSFLALAAYVSWDSVTALLARERPQRSPVGIAILALSVIVMPLLARAKRRVAEAMGSNALRGESHQTALCAYLSAIALVGVALNAVAGWWWVDPVAACVMVPIIAKEGFDGLRGRACCAVVTAPARSPSSTQRDRES